MWYGNPPPSIHCDLLSASEFGVIGDLLADFLLVGLGSADGNMLQGKTLRTALIKI